MRQGTCSSCGLTTTIRSFYSMNGKMFCEPCVWKVSREAKEAGQPGGYTAIQDNSICARCGAYSGDTADHGIVGKLPLCQNCGAQVSNWPYPQWLKISLAATLALLVVALVHGRKYFQAGREMYVGERLVEETHYEQALPHLKEALKIAPESDKAVLLTAKAALAIGEIETADKAIQGHSRGHFEDASDASFQEVKQTWDRAMRAANEANAAVKLVPQDGKAAEAARMMHEAASLYPEARGLSSQAEVLDAGAAFEAKDYDKFLAIAQKLWKQYPSGDAAGEVASALACKYAVTGDTTYKQQSEDMLETARKSVGTNPDDQKRFQEYAERIQYRLNSRQIIGIQEYNRRFRQGQATAK
jgi:tetratricopeptide (TPR) repeat protein